MNRIDNNHSRSACWRLLCVIALLGVVNSEASAQSTADLVLFGGKIVTMDEAKVTAVAIKDGQIISVGSDSEIRSFVGKATRVVALGGKLVVPGFVEGHGHLAGLGRKRINLDLAGLTSKATVLAMVKAEVAKRRPGEWLTGRGWDQNLWPEKEFPSHQELSAISPGNPVYLTRVDGHAAWVNQKAMQLAGLDQTTQDPEGGRLIRDSAGGPTGVLIDNAMGYVSRIMPAISRSELKRALKLALAESVALGITTFHDAGVDSATIDIYKELLDQGELPLRLNVMLNGSDQGLLETYFARGPEILGDDRLLIRGIKLMGDGALGSRGAALLADYSDEPGHKGLMILSEDKIFHLAKQALRAGLQVATHAIGDRTNQTVLNAYERAFQSVPSQTDPRFRVEHAQLLHPDDAPRFAKLGVIASMQASHCTSDMPWVPERIGQHRAEERAYIWQTLLKYGARVVNGSDTPVESANPLWGFYAAITRQDHGGHPVKGWNSAERMTREQALQSYTIDAAYAAFLEQKTGSISIGKAADLVILSRDIMTIPAVEILKTEVVATLVAGEVVYQIGHDKKDRTDK